VGHRLNGHYGDLAGRCGAAGTDRCSQAATEMGQRAGCGPPARLPFSVHGLTKLRAFGATGREPGRDQRCAHRSVNDVACASLPGAGARAPLVAGETWDRQTMPAICRTGGSVKLVRERARWTDPFTFVFRSSRSPAGLAQQRATQRATVVTGTVGLRHSGLTQRSATHDARRRAPSPGVGAPPAAAKS
jgi:hypothetical protein